MVREPERHSRLASIALWILAGSLACDSATDSAPALGSSSGSSGSPEFGDSGTSVSKNDAATPIRDASADAEKDASADDFALTAADAALVLARPYRFVLPAGYDSTKTVGLVVGLHGYQGNGAQIDSYLGLTAAATQKGYLLATPTGIKDSSSFTYWNATDACCNKDGAVVNDVAYLTAVVRDVAKKYKVDRKRVYFAGHSNGGFMSYRMACERASMVSAIVSLAGEDWKDAAKCAPSHAVSVLQIHGTSDATIPVAGGSLLGLPPFPSTTQTIDHWRARNQCGALVDTGQNLDLGSGIAGAESDVFRTPPCSGGTVVEYWQMNGGTHQPALAADFGTLIVTFLADHPRL